jgi:hypothetical protein
MVFNIHFSGFNSERLKKRILLLTFVRDIFFANSIKPVFKEIL